MTDELQQIADLRRRLNEWNYQYYVLDDPTVPDYEYDRALRSLEAVSYTHLSAAWIPGCCPAGKCP